MSYIFEQCELDNLLRLINRAHQLTNEETIKLLERFKHIDKAWDCIILPMMNRYILADNKTLVKCSHNKQSLPIGKEDQKRLNDGIIEIYLLHKNDEPEMGDLLHNFHTDLKKIFSTETT